MGCMVVCKDCGWYTPQWNQHMSIAEHKAIAYKNIIQFNLTDAENWRDAWFCEECFEKRKSPKDKDTQGA